MTDVDINPFGDHDKRDEQPDTFKTIPFTQGGMTERPAWGPERKQETSFGETSKKNGSSQRTHQSVVSYAIQRNRSNPRSIPFR